MKRAWRLAAVAAIPMLIGVAAFLAATADDNDEPQAAADSPPVSASSPEPLPTATANYLKAGGALFVDFLRIGASLEALGDLDARSRRESCREVAQDLTDRVDPGELLQVAAEMPDPEVAEIAIAYRRVVADVLATCLSEEQQDLAGQLDRLEVVSKAWEGAA